MPLPGDTNNDACAADALTKVVWLRGKDADLKAIADKYGFNVGLDGNEEYVYLAPNRVNLQMAQERYPDITFMETRELI